VAAACRITGLEATPQPQSNLLGKRQSNLLGKRFPPANLVAGPQPSQSSGLLFERVHHQNGRDTQRGVPVVELVQVFEGSNVEDDRIESRSGSDQFRDLEQFATRR